MTIEDRLGALVQQLTSSGGSCKELSCNSGDVSGCSSFNLQLCELVQVTAKMTQLDSICAQAAEATPAKNAEAKKWQELSINAIQLSREALVEQQKRCVQKLTELCELPTPSSMPGSKATQPGTAITPMASYTHTQKFMGPGGYMEPVEASGPAAPVGGCKSQKAPGSVSKAAAKQQVEERGWNGTLRTHLSTLQNEDPMCILIVRRINRLGFESDEALKEYFTQLGSVRHVLVAHSRVKPSAKRPIARIRPAGIGFVVMASREETIKVLSSEEHVIRNVIVQVQRYQIRCPEDAQEEEEEDAPGSSSSA